MARSRAVPLRTIELVLDHRLATRLLAHCRETGDDAVDVIVDAIALYLDEPDTAATLAAIDAVVSSGCYTPAVDEEPVS